MQSGRSDSELGFHVPGQSEKPLCCDSSTAKVSNICPSRRSDCELGVRVRPAGGCRFGFLPGRSWWSVPSRACLVLVSWFSPFSFPRGVQSLRRGTNTGPRRGQEKGERRPPNWQGSEDPFLTGILVAAKLDDQLPLLFVGRPTFWVSGSLHQEPRVAIPCRQYWEGGARLCTSSVNRRLLVPPTGCVHRDVLWTV